MPAEDHPWACTYQSHVLPACTPPGADVNTTGRRDQTQKTRDEIRCRVMFQQPTQRSYSVFWLEKAPTPNWIPGSVAAGLGG